MTTDAQQELLKAMTAGAAAANSVSTFKTPLKSFDGRPLRVEIKDDGYDKRSQIHLIWGDLANIQADTPLAGDEFDWAMNMPAKVTKNSPLGAFLTSGAALRPDLDNIPDIVASGLKFHVERVVIPGQGTDRSGKPMNDSSGYELKAIVDGSTAAAAAPAAEANPETLAAVLKFASGLTQQQFQETVLKELQGAAADSVIRTAIINRTFLKDQVAAGKLVEAEGVYATV